MVNGITFAEQLITSADFAHFMYTFLNKANGVTKGCGISYSDTDVYVQKGYFMEFGRMVQVIGTEEISMPEVVSGQLYCKVVFEIDLSQTNTAEEFNQGYFKTLTNVSDYPEVTQEDLDDGGTVYQMPWCQYIKTVDAVSEFRDLREVLNLESVWDSVAEQNGNYKGEFDTYFGAQKAVIEKMIADLEDQGYVLIESARTVKELTLAVEGWTETDEEVVEQVIEVEGIREEMVPDYGVIYPIACTREQQKAINKAAGYIYDIETGNGTVTVRCTETPAIEFTIGLKGVI